MILKSKPNTDRLMKLEKEISLVISTIGFVEEFENDVTIRCTKFLLLREKSVS